MTRLINSIIIVVLLLILCNVVWGIERFPPPDFESGYQIPKATTPPPREKFHEILDVTVLFAALVLSTYLALKKRNRRLIFLLMVFSMIYFGFYREGCICPIGAIGNIVLSFFDSSYAMPLTALAFFLLPLVFTLFFGRIFCGSVCPLGAIQDVVLLKPISVPSWLERALRIMAYVYIGLAVLFAATGSAFIICRYDPFVAFFRLSGRLNIVVIGICFLVAGIFVGRPYCRFFCPYGVILRQFSRISKWRVTITPDECIKCRLCEEACPFGAIDKPTVQWPSKGYLGSKKILGFLIIILPVLMILCGWTGSSLSGSTSRMHFTVRLAERVYIEDNGLVKDTTEESKAFRAKGEPTEQLYQKASVLKEQFRFGGWLLGSFVGFVIGMKLILQSIWWSRSEYEANRAGCFACGRCFEYCPKEHERLEKLK